MQLIDKHKALIITVLLTGTVVFALFSIHITKQAEFIAESLYEIEPKTDEELKQELIKQNQDTEALTNKAFNEDQEFKELMKNFKMVSANDFEKTTKAIEENKIDSESELTTNTTSGSNNSYAIKKSETDSYNKLKDLVNKKSSTLTYSLKNRTLLSYNTPRYLCERTGKIVVNIRVNQNGDVFESYINGSSNSDNECLTEHALEYAKSVRFNSSNRADQLGSITFYFKGKN